MHESHFEVTWCQTIVISSLIYVDKLMHVTQKKIYFNIKVFYVQHLSKCITENVANGGLSQLLYIGYFSINCVLKYAWYTDSYPNTGQGEDKVPIERKTTRSMTSILL